MILTNRLVSILGLLGVTWQECGENPAIFCYRIGWQVVQPLREQFVAEDQASICSAPPVNSSIPSMTSED